jgi:hypothetical protein
MATAFDGIGMSQLGSERRYMTGDNPISQGLKGLKDFAMLTAIDKSGLAGFLNDIGKQKQELENKYKPQPVAGAVAPTNQPMPVNPQAALPQTQIDPNANNQLGGNLFDNSVQQPQKSIEDAADEAMGLSKSTSFVTPDAFKPNNESNQVQQQVASGFPPPMQLPQYDGKGAGMSLLKLFLAG